MSSEQQQEVVQRTDVFSKIQLWFENNQKIVTYIISAIAAVIVLYWAYTKFYQEPRQIEAANELFPLEKAFGQDSMDLVLKGINGGMSAPNIADEYSGTKAGNLAAYMSGVAFFTKGEYDKAIDYLEDFKASDPLLAPNKIGLIGDCYAAKKELEKAAKYFSKAGKKSINNLTTPHWLFKAGAAYEKLGEWDDAVSVYEFIKKNCKDAPTATQIDKYISYAQARSGDLTDK